MPVGERLLALLQGIDPSPRAVLMIGHNPGFQDLARLLVGHGDRYAFSRMMDGFPTAALCVLDFDGEDWAGIGPRGARLDRFVTPKSLGADEED